MAAQAGSSLTWSKTPKTGWLVTMSISLLQVGLLIIAENKHINSQEINLERVITTNHGPTLRFASGINIDLGPQQTLNTSNRDSILYTL